MLVGLISLVGDDCRAWASTLWQRMRETAVKPQAKSPVEPPTVSEQRRQALTHALLEEADLIARRQRHADIVYPIHWLSHKTSPIDLLIYTRAFNQYHSLVRPFLLLIFTELSRKKRCKEGNLRERERTGGYGRMRN